MKNESQQTFSDSQSYDYIPEEEGSEEIKVARSKNKTRCNKSPTPRNFLKKEQKGYFWSRNENLRYRQFLISHNELLSQPLKVRRSSKINVLMSDFIRTRSSNQCRSHHQKMLKYYKDISSIIRSIQISEEDSNLFPLEAENSKTEKISIQLMEIDQMEIGKSLFESLLSLADTLSP